MRRAFMAIVLMLASLAATAMAEVKTSPLVIDTEGGARRFTVEFAATAEEQAQGLMFRRTLAADAGMLFDLGGTRPATFWMKNTLIPLDMLFISADGRIADIHERAVPLSEAMIESKAPVRAVLELNGGTAARLGIHEGDVVHHPLFGNAS
jgi:uncharacterized protein